MELKNIIKKYREDHNMSLRDFAQRCDLSYSYIGMLEKGTRYGTEKEITPTLDALYKLAKGMNMDIDDLFSSINSINVNLTNIAPKFEKPKPNPAVVLVYGKIPAGVPMEMIEDILDTEEISADMLKGGKQYFGLKIKGDSMEPDYLDGDVIIFQKVDDCENGDDCVVMVNGNEGTFKRVFKNENGIILQPLNNKYQPMPYSNEEIEKLPVKILGVFEELRRKKRRK